ncbi:MAG TPA: hypothetical protein VFJ90_00095 [Candidatus Didemnitutus sp.]|nr:hypothetical protein [Candidatus Didemnitutus sp.]
MNKYYLIAPAALLLAFLFTPSVGYFSAQKEIEARLEAENKRKADVAAAEAARKAEIERKATLDAQKRQAERDAEEAAKIAKKEKDYADAMNKLKDETNGYVADTDKLVKENAELEVQLAALRNQKEKANRETFELAKQVELAKVSRRNAELEIQRMVEMVGTKAGASTLANAPTPPATSK